MLQSLDQWFSTVFRPDLLERLLSIAFFLVLGFVIVRLIESGIKRLGAIMPPEKRGDPRAEQRIEKLKLIIRSASRMAVGVVVLLSIADALEINVRALLTTAGILGLTIGFGAQSLIKDLIAGFFILFEDQYGVGDVVRIGQQDGVVERMTLRVTVLRNLEGQVHVIPNGTIQTVTVLTKDWARAVIDVTVSHREDLERVFQILERIGSGLLQDMPDHVLEKPQVLGIERLSEEGVTIRSIVKTPPLKQWEVMREWRRRIKGAFAHAGIEIPQRNLMMLAQGGEERAAQKEVEAR